MDLLHLHKAVEASGEVVFLTDRDGTITYVNPAFVRLYGYSPSEVIGRATPRILKGGLYQPERYAKFWQTLLSKQVVSGVLINRTKDGRLLEVEGSANPIIDDNGDIVGFFAVQRDITERRRLDEALRRSEAILSAINLAAERFLRGRDWRQNIAEVLARLGEGAGVSRVVIFQCRQVPDGEVFITRVHEWQEPGMEPRDDSRLRNLPLREMGYSRWIETLTRGGLIVSDVADLPASEQAGLSTQGIRSVVAVPIFAGDEWWGFIGLDECRKERTWEEVETDALNAAARILGEVIEHERAEAALHESRQRLQAIVEGTSDAIYLKDVKGRYVLLNAAASRFVGVEPNVVIGRDDTFLFTPEEARVVMERDREVMAGSTVTTYEERLTAADGQQATFLATKGPIFDESGAVVGLFGIARDITERKWAEAMLHESEVRYRGLFEANPHSMWVYDPKTLAFLQVNDAAVAHYGYQRDEFLAMTIADIRPAEDVARLLENVARTDDGAMDEGSVWRHRKKDGSIIDVEVTVHGIDHGGRRARLVLALDITERKRAEESLRLESAALHAAADAVVITDRAGVIEWVNPAFIRLTGYTGDEALGKNPRELVKSGKHAPAFYQEFWETILAGRTWHGEMINRRKDGALYTEDQSVTPILDASGAITHFVAIKKDITERLLLEAQFRQAQKMESVGQLASGIAHDFNNLLTVINGMSDLVLAQLGDDDPARADVQEIHRAGARAAALTRQLLAFSRQQILELRVMSFNTVVSGMESLLRRLLGEDIDLVTVLTPEVGRVKADLGQIEQVISNLAVNARDAMPQGGRLTIETQNVTIGEDYARQHRVTVSPGSYVLLAVSDSGTGMSEATRARIFEPFFTTKGAGKGTGLGLSTVYGIVKQSQGFIWVYSEIGQGTTFKIHLPRVTDAAGPERPEPTSLSRAGTETILLVEDNAALRKLATRFLEPAGYTVLGAATGDEALRLLERQEAPVHLLLSDVVMPGMSGRQLAERLAQTHPGMKVLYVSGYTSDTIVRHGVLDAQVPFLSKPFTAPALLQKVREVLDS